MIEELLQEAEQSKNAGDDEKTVQIYQQAIQLCANDDSQTSQLAYCLQQLAQIFSDYGQFSDAIPLYKQLIALGDKILGSEHPDTISAGVNLARTYEANGQPELADQEYKLATSKAEKALGIGDPMAQEIRQEYFETISNRQVVEEDKLRHGLTLERASSTFTNQPAIKTNSTESGSVKKDDLRPAKKYSSLKQSTKIKKLRYVAESVDEQSGNLLKAHGLRRHGRDIFYIISVILCVVAIFVAFSKLSVPTKLVDNNLIAQRLIGSVFKSVDGFNGIQFIDNKYAVLINDVHHRKIPYILLKGGMRDLKDLILGMLVRNESWFQLNQDELTTEDGNIFYEGDAPENFLVKKMQNLADFARHYYLQNNCYPDKAEKLKGESGLAYINPFINKVEMPTIKRLSASYTKDAIFPGIKAEANLNECYWFLRHGGIWRDDLVASAGKISALSLFTSQRCADGYKVTDFYIHGFDRHGKLITAGKPETFFTIGLHAGHDMNDDNHERTAETEHASVHPPEKIYIIPGDLVDIHFWRQFLAGMLVGTIVLSFVAWLAFEAKKRRLNPSARIQPLEFIFIFSLCLGVYVALIHSIP